MSAPNLKEIEWAISQLEDQESSEGRYTLLASLYTCRDHLLGPQPPVAAYAQPTAVDSAPVDQYGGSDFLRAVAGKDPAAAWSVMDELMETLRVVNSRAYSSVLRKLDRL